MAFQKRRKRLIRMTGWFSVFFCCDRSLLWFILFFLPRELGISRFRQTDSTKPKQCLQIWTMILRKISCECFTCLFLVFLKIEVGFAAKI